MLSWLCIWDPIHSAHVFFMLNRVYFSLMNVWNSSTWDRNYKISLKWTPLPPPFLHTASNQSKTGQWEGLGTRLGCQCILVVRWTGPSSLTSVREPHTDVSGYYQGCKQSRCWLLSGLQAIKAAASLVALCNYINQSKPLITIHCLFSLTITMVTTLWLKQPICFFAVIVHWS